MIDQANSYMRENGLYNASYEHDACGVGMVVNIKGIKSHQLVDNALLILENMRHRGAEGADKKQVMVRVFCYRFHMSLSCYKEYLCRKKYLWNRVGIFPKNFELEQNLEEIFEEEAAALGLNIMSWRKVPTNSNVLGETAQETEPDIKQIFVVSDIPLSQDELERKLYLMRKRIENKGRSYNDFYIVSLSATHIIYKGMLSSLQVRQYFPDLQDQFLQVD